MGPYVAYRDSEIPWLSRIPVHWGAVPLMSVLKESKVRNVDLVERNLLSLSFGRIVRKDIDAVSGLLPDSFETYQIIEPNHLVFRFTDLQNDQRSLRSARATERGIITSAYISAKPTGIDARYAEYLMRSYDLTKVFYGLGGGVRQTLKFADVARLPVLLPPLIEQRAIADYLDRETARIGTLIEEKERLIHLLRERRRTVIDHEMTTDSERAKFSRLFTFHNGDRGASYPSRDEFVSDGVPFVNAGHLRDGRASYAEMNYMTLEKYQEMGGAKLRSGDVLFCLRGSLGKFGYFDGEYGGALASSLVAMRRIDPNRLNLRYFLHFLASSSMADAIRLVETGTAQPNLSVEQLTRLTVPLPPVEVQRSIAHRLDEETEKINRLVTETERYIELARERRSALVSAAVTGQIDVRTVA